MTFQLTKVQVHDRLSLEELALEQGKLIHIVGQNGAGKSTLLDVISGLNDAYFDCVKFNGRLLSEWSPAELASQRCYLVQSIRSEFDITVAQLLSFYSIQTQIPEDIEGALHLEPLMNKTINTLSGGEQQRVHIARTLMQIWPAICSGWGAIVLDEPTQHLDINYQLKLMALLTELARKGNLVLQTCHDVNLTLRYSDQCLLLTSGKATAFGDSKTVLTRENLAVCLGCDFHLTYAENAYEFFYPVLNSDTSV